MTRAVILAAMLILATPRGEPDNLPKAEGRTLWAGVAVPALRGAPRNEGYRYRVGKLRLAAPTPRTDGLVLSSGEHRGTWAFAAPSHGSRYSGSASWFDARGDQAAVPWWTPGMDPVWASVSTFRDGRTFSVSVLITGFCQCYVGTPRERVMDLSRNAFAQLADPSVGLIRVQIEVPSQGPPLPATDAEAVQ